MSLAGMGPGLWARGPAGLRPGESGGFGFAGRLPQRPLRKLRTRRPSLPAVRAAREEIPTHASPRFFCKAGVVPVAQGHGQRVCGTRVAGGPRATPHPVCGGGAASQAGNTGWGEQKAEQWVGHRRGLEQHLGKMQDLFVVCLPES